MMLLEALGMFDSYGVLKLLRGRTRFTFAYDRKMQGTHSFVLVGSLVVSSAFLLRMHFPVHDAYVHFSATSSMALINLKKYLNAGVKGDQRTASYFGCESCFFSILAKDPVLCVV